MEDRSPQIQKQGVQTLQCEPLPGQIENPAGGYSFILTDIDRLTSFLCLGKELYYYRAGQLQNRFIRSEVQSIDRLISNDRGREVVKLIRDISVHGRACKQSPSLYALAVCARSNSLETKTAAYGMLNDVCRIPTHLFQFIKYCEEMNEYHTGWGRAHRMAISNWYKNFKQQDPDSWHHPKRLAYLVTKYIRRFGYSHKDIIRLSHVRSRSPAIRMIVQFILGKNMDTPSDEESKVVFEFLQAAKSVKNCRYPEDEDEVCNLIALHRLSREQVPNRFLRGNLKVWNVLIRDMPMTSMIRHLGKLTMLQQFNSPEYNDLFERLVEDKLNDHVLLRNARIHPLTLLIALKHYNKGRSRYKDHVQWDPNPRISRALENAFYNCPTILPPTNQKYLMAISAGENMRKEICRSTIKASEAAAAMVLSTLKIRSTNVETLVFTDSLEESCLVQIDQNDNLQTIEQKIFEIPINLGSSLVREDLSIPFKWAAERKERFNAIIVFTDSLSSCGYLHPAEIVKQYAEYMAVPNYRLVVVSMTSDKFTIAAPDDGRSLDVIGFDTHTPGIIMDFINKFEWRSNEDEVEEMDYVDIH